MFASRSGNPEELQAVVATKKRNRLRSLAHLVDARANMCQWQCGGSERSSFLRTTFCTFFQHPLLSKGIMHAAQYNVSTRAPNGTARKGTP